MLLVLLFIPNYVRSVSETIRNTEPMAWLLIIWISFLPPLWVTLDLFLHREELIRCHHLSLSCPKRCLKFARVILHLFWLFTCFPILGVAWYSLTHPKDDIVSISLNNLEIFCPILLGVCILAGLLFLAGIRKISSKKGKALESSGSIDTKSKFAHSPRELMVTPHEETPTY